MSMLINKIVLLSDTWPKISADDAQRLHERHEDDLPEECFLNDCVGEDDSYSDIQCPAKKCAIWNDSDAVFCKKCGTRLKDENENVEINLAWCGAYSAETFEKIFVKKVVPHLVGDFAAMVAYGDENEPGPWKTFAFKVVNGELSYHFFELGGAVDAPDFELDQDDEEDEEDDDE